MTIDELAEREGSDILERLAWFPCLSVDELQWMQGMSDSGIQFSVIPEDNKLSIYRVDR